MQLLDKSVMEVALLSGVVGQAKRDKHIGWFVRIETPDGTDLAAAEYHQLGGEPGARLVERAFAQVLVKMAEGEYSWVRGVKEKVGVRDGFYWHHRLELEVAMLWLEVYRQKVVVNVRRPPMVEDTSMQDTYLRTKERWLYDVDVRRWAAPVLLAAPVVAAKVTGKKVSLFSTALSASTLKEF